MNELMKLLDENLICTDIEIQLTLERTQKMSFMAGISSFA